MRREPGQLSLADGLVEGGAGRNRQLERIAALVDWAALERLLGGIDAAPFGRPSYGPVVLPQRPLQPCCRVSDPVPPVRCRHGFPGSHNGMDASR